MKEWTEKKRSKWQLVWEPILDNSGILVINSTIKYAVPIIHILNEKTKKKTNIEKFTAN